MRLGRWVGRALAVSFAAGQLAAQPPVAEPSRADSLLAIGRLAAAERELYAAVTAYPRQSAPRGALARYLASRGRFRIAEVLLEEAQRFGADPAVVARAVVEMAPYRGRVDLRRVPGVRLPPALAAREAARVSNGYVESIDGDEVVVPVEMGEDGVTLLRVALRGPGGIVWATIDPSREGVAIATATDSTIPARVFGVERVGAPVLVRELWIGERRLSWLDATIDPTVPAGEVRFGLDMFWRLRAVVDERAGTMRLLRASTRTVAPAGAVQIPFMLGFPGLWLVPRAYRAPVALESPAGRAMLRGSRWQLDIEGATVIVER